MKGIETQASIASTEKRAIQGETKKVGCSQPIIRISRATGP